MYKKYEVLTKKKAADGEYKQAIAEMQEFVQAKHNIDMFVEKEQSQEQEQKKQRDKTKPR